MADDSDHEADGPASDADGTNADASNDPSSADSSATQGRSRPDVVVPMDLYKTVTVFSTLFAIALVVGGMIALDAATGRATVDAADVNLPVALLGVGAIVLGAATYAFASRFRAEGMGNPKDGDDKG